MSTTDPTAPLPGAAPIPPALPTAGATIDLSTPRRIHVVGVGGSGMSAIATVLAGMGHRVTGSDLRASAGLERLEALGVTVAVGHAAANLSADVEIVTRSTAIPDRNPEVVEARARGIEVVNRASILGAIAAERRAIAVAGTHGKTTTSSMLALVLVEAGLRPSFIIGGDVNAFGTGAVWDTGDTMVVEADESDGTFVTLPRAAAIVTNIEPDHLEHWGGFENLLASFERFVTETTGPVVMGADDAIAAELAARTGATTFGTAEGASYRMGAVDRSRAGTAFSFSHAGIELGEVRVPVAGEYNARNAAAAVAMALELGVPFEAAQAAMGRFAGVARRFQYRGEARGITFIDDYAHLPTEVADALSAARDGAWDRVVCVFQPHRFSRTAALWSTFADAFTAADVLVVTDIYASGEAPRPGVSGKLIVDAVLDAHPRQRLVYLPHHADLVSFLGHELRSGDLCLTLGAGDLTTLPDELLQHLAPTPVGPTS